MCDEHPTFKHSDDEGRHPSSSQVPHLTPSNRSPLTPQQRQAVADAAEARLQSSKQRGVQAGGGKLHQALVHQKADGGRVDEAMAIGSGSTSRPLVVSESQVLGNAISFGALGRN